MRGQRNTRKAIFGQCGEWLCVTHKWKWDEENFVRTFALDDGEKLHIMFVYDWEIEAVFQAINSIWSFSKHLGSRLLFEAVYLNPKIRVWSHGLVRPDVNAAKISGIKEEHAERLPKAKAPWVVPQEDGGIQYSQPKIPAAVKTPIIRL